MARKSRHFAEQHWIYKGRVVFGGERVKDESGFHAVFSEQGTSASHMAVAKFMAPPQGVNAWTVRTLTPSVRTLK